MKKLILGLCLTVGVSGMSSAFSAVENSFNSKKEDILKTNDNYVTLDLNFNSQEIFLSCYHGYITVVTGCDGMKSQVNLGGHSSSCGEGEEEGTMTIHVTKINGCKAGPLNDFNAAIEAVKDLF